MGQGTLKFPGPAKVRSTLLHNYFQRSNALTPLSHPIRVLSPKIEVQLATELVTREYDPPFLRGRGFPFCTHTRDTLKLGRTDEPSGN